MIEETPISCGVIELYELNKHPKSLIKEIILYNNQYEVSKDRYNAVIYSDNIEIGNGEKLTNYILKHKLGTVTKTRAFVNSAHDSKIKVYVWIINWKNLDKWRDKNV